MFSDSLITTQPPPNGRGCGKSRTEESPYACTGLDAEGVPIEHFLVDPVIPWPGGWQRGAKIIQKGDTHHLVIFIGKEFYPSPWDYLEETRRFGASRKLPKNLPFHLLTPGKSLMLLVHARAFPIFNFTLRPTDAGAQTPLFGCKWQPPADDERDDPWLDVARGWHPKPIKPVNSCTSALRDLTALMRPTEPLMGGDGQPLDGWREVEMPSFKYSVREPLAPTEAGNWGIGLFMALPLTHFEFAHQADPEVQETLNRAGYETPVLDW